jgi:hypothetical protein
MSERDLADHLATAARKLQSETDVENTLEKAIGLRVELIECCDDAGVSVVQRKGIDHARCCSGDSC